MMTPLEDGRNTNLLSMTGTKFLDANMKQTRTTIEGCLYNSSKLPKKSCLKPCSKCSYTSFLPDSDLDDSSDAVAMVAAAVATASGSPESRVRRRMTPNRATSSFEVDRVRQENRRSQRRPRRHRSSNPKLAVPKTILKKTSSYSALDRFASEPDFMTPTTKAEAKRVSFPELSSGRWDSQGSGLNLKSLASSSKKQEQKDKLKGNFEWNTTTNSSTFCSRSTSSRTASDLTPLILGEKDVTAAHQSNKDRQLLAKRPPNKPSRWMESSPVNNVGAGRVEKATESANVLQKSIDNFKKHQQPPKMPMRRRMSPVLSPKSNVFQESVMDFQAVLVYPSQRGKFS